MVSYFQLFLYIRLWQLLAYHLFLTWHSSFLIYRFQHVAYAAYCVNHSYKYYWKCTLLSIKTIDQYWSSVPSWIYLYIWIFPSIYILSKINMHKICKKKINLCGRRTLIFTLVVLNPEDKVYIFQKLITYIQNKSELQLFFSGYWSDGGMWCPVLCGHLSQSLHVIIKVVLLPLYKWWRDVFEPITYERRGQIWNAMVKLSLLKLCPQFK